MKVCALNLIYIGRMHNYNMFMFQITFTYLLSLPVSWLSFLCKTRSYSWSYYIVSIQWSCQFIESTETLCLWSSASRLVYIHTVFFCIFTLLKLRVSHTDRIILYIYCCHSRLQPDFYSQVDRRFCTPIVAMQEFGWC